MALCKPDLDYIENIDCLPDLIRYTLTRSLANETDRNKALMWRTVLDGYDAGLINGQISVLDTCVKWTPAEIN